MQAAQDTRTLFLRRPPETCERSLGGGNGPSRILLVRQSCMGEDFSVGWVDYIHYLAAVGFNVRPVDIVLRDCVHACLSLYEDLEPEPGEKDARVRAIL